MVDSITKETFDAERDAEDVIVSPDSKELENISKMVGSFFLLFLNSFLRLKMC